MAVFNTQEAAEFLGIGVSTLYRNLRKKKKKGKIPAAKFDGKWCFVEEDLVAYLRSLYSSKIEIDHQVNSWQLKNEVKKVSITSNSRLKMENEYESLLALPTKIKRQN